MRKHLQLLRVGALGRVEPLLEAVSHDPAALVGLDCVDNRKSRPNENYARALMGSFTLGPGNFSPADVHEATRAFTGWFVLHNEIRYVDREHDPGVKRLLGQEGNFTSSDVVRLLLEQPATPRLLVRKLFRWFVAETEAPSDALLEPLVESFARHYDVHKLVETILRSNLFFSPAAYRRRIKSPLEFVLGMVRGLEGLVPTDRLGQDLAALGQNLLHPPTVKGWAGGSHWIHEATLVGRSKLALALLSGKKPYGDRINPLAIAQKHGHGTPPSAGKFLLDLLVQSDLPANVLDALGDSLSQPDAATGGDLSGQLRQFVHLIVTLPEFQLS